MAINEEEKEDCLKQAKEMTTISAGAKVSQNYSLLSQKLPDVLVNKIRAVHLHPVTGPLYVLDRDLALAYLAWQLG